MPGDWACFKIVSNMSALGDCFACGGAPVLMDSTASGRSLLLSNKNRRNLESMWQLVPDKMELAKLIFMRIFKMKPSLKILWRIESVTEDELNSDPMLHRHATSFSMFLDVAVSKLSRDPIDLVALVRNVGKRHASYKAVSFDAENWLLFKNSVLDNLEPYYEPVMGTKTAGRNLWNRFLMFLIMEMKHAFYLETTKRHSCEDIRKHLNGGLYKQLEDHYKDCVENGDDSYKEHK